MLYSFCGHKNQQWSIFSRVDGGTPLWRHLLSHSQNTGICQCKTGCRLPNSHIASDQSGQQTMIRAPRT